MGNKFEEMGEKKWADITKLIKVISESVKDFYKRSRTDGSTPEDGDTSLMSMQILSILCGLQRGYSKEKMQKMWAASLTTAGKIHEARTSDKVVSKLQVPPGFENRHKN